MRSTILALVVLFSMSAQANQVHFSDLTQTQRDGILIGLQTFLPKYKVALEISLHNVKRKAMGTMDVNAQMSEMVFANGTAENIFETVGTMVDEDLLMTGFPVARGSQTFAQANKEAAQADSLNTHVWRFPENKKLWMKHMNSQVQVIAAGERGATVRLLHFPRANCTITASSSKVVRQHCN